ncbi:hypothetical protein OLMES_2163 [Oleiphilus messinensis]|uniref:Uncharacterized protein n=1 Tax=Oleiphilus messinensis TaxID=141451 RepID=A0A1Y0IA13_9GAMM|nr:hypothetical protein OLMES_2163 [Oleiphilus messinensis]
MMRKARKIRSRVNASNNLFESVWEKPKGMHWKTFERLKREEMQANQASTFAMAEKLRLLNKNEWLAG